MSSWITRLNVGDNLYVGVQYNSRVLYRKGKYVGNDGKILKLLGVRNYRYKTANISWKIPIEKIRICRLEDTLEVLYLFPQCINEKK